MAPTSVRLVVVIALAIAGCRGDDGGDAARFCEQLDRLAENDPFLAFGDTASEAEMAEAFTALRERAEDLRAAAPDGARGAATDYRNAVVGLDEILADAGYGTDVDLRAYREHQTAYVESAQRLERYLETDC